MEKMATVNYVSAPAWQARLNQVMIFASAICLGLVFYANGTFSTLWSSSSEPDDNGVKMAAGVPANKTTATTSITNVVDKALVFKNMLTTAQQATLEQTYTATLARKWSNLPCGATCRNGIQFGTLTSAQLSAALDVIKAALSSSTDNGWDEFYANYLAEAYLHANGGGSGYDTTLRWICFLNTPSETGAWMLQFGGHHYAANISFNNGHLIGGTPYFQGLEPLSFTFNSTTYAPLTDERDTFAAMLASLSSAELTTAKLSASFSDCVMVPGETNGGTSTFPAYNMGVACSTLTTAQKNLVLAAIRNYVGDMEETEADAIMATYAAQIDTTYISWRGNGTAGSSSSFFTAQGDYVRISGPTVWIELSCQNGVVIPGQIHYHTVWRDRAHDYGVDLTGDPIDGTTAVTSVSKNSSLIVYPNPATGQLTITFGTNVANGTLSVVNAITGQVMKVQSNINRSSLVMDISALATGNYILKMEDGSSAYVGKFTKL
jgi:hypothetical protein